MQTLSNALISAQQAIGKIPALTFTAYDDRFIYTPVNSSLYTPNAGETIIASDSCSIDSPLAGQGVISTIITKEAGTNEIRVYARFVLGADFSISSDWSNFTLITTSISFTSLSNALGCSISTDNAANGANNFFTIGVLGYSNSSNVTDWVANRLLCEFTSASVFALSTFSSYVFSTENGTFGGVSNSLGIWVGYNTSISKGIYICSTTSDNLNYFLQLYDEGSGKLLQSIASGYGQIYQIECIYDSIAGAEFGNSAWYHGVVLAYDNSISTTSVQTFAYNFNTFTMQPFRLDGNANSDYSVNECSLSIAQIGYNPLNYPTLINSYVLCFSLTSSTNSYSGYFVSSDFIHWGNLKIFDPINSRPFKLLSAGSNYVIIADNDLNAFIFTRNLITTDISNDIVNFDIQKSPDGSAGSLSLELSNMNNKYTGSNSPITAIKRNARIFTEIGYYTSLGNETVPGGVFYIDTITQNTSAKDNQLTIKCRDSFKKLYNFSFPNSLEYYSQSRYIEGFNANQFSQNWYIPSVPSTTDGYAIWSMQNNSIVNQPLSPGVSTYGEMLYMNQSFSKGIDVYMNVTYGASVGDCGISIQCGTHNYIFAFYNTTFVSGSDWSGTVAIYDIQSSSTYGHEDYFVYLGVDFLGYTALTSTTDTFNIQNMNMRVNIQNGFSTFFINGISILSYQLPFSGGNYFPGLYSCYNPNYSTANFSFTSFIVNDFNPYYSTEFLIEDVSNFGGINTLLLPSQFSDNFTNLNNYQTTSLANFSVSSNTLSGATGSIQNLLISNSSFSEFIFECLVQLSTTGNAGLAFLIQDSSNYYYFDLITLSIHLVQVGVDTQLNKNSNISISSGIYYKLSVAVHNGWIIGRINDTTVVSVYSSIWTNGYIGLRAYNTAYFQNLNLPYLYEEISNYSITSNNNMLSALGDLTQIKYCYYGMNNIDQLIIDDFQTSDPSVYSYENELVNNQLDQDDSYMYNEVIVYGANNLYSTVIDQAGILEVNNEIRIYTVTDETLITQNQCDHRAQRELLNIQRYHIQPNVELDPNVGQEIFDVVEITDNTSGIIQSEYITNTNFDSDTVGNVPAWWVQYQTAGTTTVAVTNSQYHSSPNSLEISAISNCDGGVISPVINLNAGDGYMLSGWIMTGANVTNACIVVSDVTLGVVLLGLHQYLNYDGWVNFSGTFKNLSSTSNIKIYLGLGSFGPQSYGTVYFDDITLTNLNNYRVMNIDLSYQSSNATFNQKLGLATI